MNADRCPIVTIPCFAGAPWNLAQLTPLVDWPLCTMRLPDTPRSVEEVADFIAQQVEDLDEFVLLGDSFGAICALAFAIRRPKGLKALIMSGGFAKDPIQSPWLQAMTKLVPFFPGPFYRHVTLKVHAAQLVSRFDADGEITWNANKTWRFFVGETSHRAYVSRIAAIQDADYSRRLGDVVVPTLILTPEDDKLIGPDAARTLREGIPDCDEKVLSGTGHMFRFSHPVRYAQAVREFLEQPR